MDTNDQKIDHLFRRQYGKMVAILTRLYTFSDLEKVEDIVQDTFVKALANWRINGLPHNPEAWLMSVAKNRAIDFFRSNKSSRTDAIEQYSGTSSIAIENLFLEKEISDAQLRMIFACCHPLLSESDQIAITLQIVSGFSVKEIAAALLKPSEQIKKRIQRAKAKLKSNKIKLSIPQGEDLIARRSSLLKVIYLLFNEGYLTSNSKELINKELCLEALRLGKLVCDHHITNHHNANALVGLMCFLSARFESRMNNNGQIVLLENQDRTLWDKGLIYMGNKYMYQSIETNQYSKYHYEAAIQSEYIKASSFQDTNWDQLLEWYRRLKEIDPSPMIDLNIAIVMMYKGELLQSKTALLELDLKLFGSRKYLLLTTLGKVHELLHEKNQAINYLLD